MALKLSACAALGLSACSARSSLPTDEPPLTPSYRPLSHCSDPLWVEGGEAFVGWVSVQGTEPVGERPNYYVRPQECHPYRFNGFVNVSSYYLDADEVTPACYAECVDAGACEPAEDREEGRPLVVTKEEAEAFCAFRGGALPTYAQFARAGSADAESVGLPSLLTSLAQCWDVTVVHWEEVFETCNFRLNRAGLLDDPAYPQLNPRADPMDVGPFGHYDLFAGQIEWTRSLSNFDGQTAVPLDVSCEGPPIDDPVDFGDGLTLLYGPAASMHFGLSNFSPFAAEAFPLASKVTSDPHLSTYVGFRCAYDMVEPEP